MKQTKLFQAPKKNRKEKPPKNVVETKISVNIATFVRKILEEK